MSDVTIKDVFLETELAGYENVFQVGDLRLRNLLESTQPIINSTIQDMRNYKASVNQALIDIAAKQEADRIAAEEAAAAAAAAEKKSNWSEALEAGNDAYNNAIKSGVDMPGAAGAYIGGFISELID